MSKIDYKKMDKYVDGKLIEKGKDEKSEIFNHYWWKDYEDERMLALQIASTINFIERHNSARIEQLVISTRLYGNTNSFSLTGTSFTRANNVNTAPSGQRITYNLTQSCIDTLTSKMAKNKFVPSFATSGGVWKMQKKAEQLNKFMEGIFYEHHIHKKRILAFRDACVWGDGILHIFRDNNELKIERVLPHEIFVDNVESVSNEPRQMHRVKIVDREIMLEMYKDDEEACEKIKSVLPANYTDTSSTGSVADLIRVTESWHLPSGPEVKDGLHVICAGDCVLTCEEYDKDYFPFAFITWNKRLIGFWGAGLCEELMSIQSELNRLLILVQKSLWMGGSFKVLMEHGSRIVKQHINNDVGIIIEHAPGAPPQYITPPVVQPEIYQHIQTLIDLGFKKARISQLSVSGEKPMGLDSGKALRAMTDIEDMGFIFIEQQMEEFGLEIARQCIEVVKDIYRDKKTFKTCFPQAKFLESVDWKDIKLEDDEYVMQAFPVSSLSKDITGRLNDVQELMQAGIVTPRTGRRLLSMPDIEMNDKLANASENLICKVIEDLLEEEAEYNPPEPQFDLQAALTLGLEYYNYAMLNNCPEENLSLLRQWIEEVKDMQAKAMQAMAPPPGSPQAVPQAPPQSQLLPNVPGGMQ